MMLTRMKNKIRSVRKKGTKKLSHDPEKINKYMIFDEGSEEHFLRNGALSLEESISTFHGRSSNPIRHFSVNDLNNMNVEKLPLHEDGHYSLYQGCWEGSDVLVKKGINYNDDEFKSFIRDIAVATQMATHNNAHKLLGCCLETESPILIYDGMANVTLHNEILGDPNNQNKQVIEWKDRLRIAWEVSHVVAYLHTAFPRPIIHRDLKPGNVLLDQDNIAKLSDFSFSMSIPEGEDVLEVDRIIGTYGYMAPEYLLHGQLAESADVYAFGMLFLVILTGKKPSHNMNLTSEDDEDTDKPTTLIAWVCKGLNDNTIKKIVDPTIIARKAMTAVEDAQLRASLELALRCVSVEKDHRPTMMEVATELKNLIAYHEIRESSPIEDNNEEGLTYKKYSGRKENRVANEAMLLEESILLFHGRLNHIHHFSASDLNNMKVEQGLIYRDDDWLWYQGLWEGRAVLVKHPEGVKDQVISDKILVRLMREILIATQMATCSSNVHTLLGCCLETSFPVLVYEWLKLENLTSRICFEDEDINELPLLEWNDRLRIASEISQVVSYLHTSFPRPIIYNLLGPVTVFLDEYDTPKLSNFSRSISIADGKEFAVVEDFEIFHMKDHYMPLEFCKHSKVGMCTDVYSFGVFFLLLLTGKSVYEYNSNWGTVEEEDEDIIECVQKAISNNCLSKILDPGITRNGMTIVEDLQIKASAQVAIKCVVENHGCRPTMVEVATELSNIIRYQPYESIPRLRKKLI